MVFTTLGKTIRGQQGFLNIGGTTKTNTEILIQMETLKALTGKLIQSFTNDAGKNQSFFINDIPSHVVVDHNQAWVSSVISGLLDTIVHHCRETCIRLTARQYGYVVVLEVRESGSINSYAMACALQTSNSMAEQIGGCLSISVHEPTTTVAFSFPNLPIAA